jgi:hypothetical protein
VQSLPTWHTNCRCFNPLSSGHRITHSTEG